MNIYIYVLRQENGADLALSEQLWHEAVRAEELEEFGEVHRGPAPRGVVGRVVAAVRCAQVGLKSWRRACSRGGSFRGGSCPEAGLPEGGS